MPSAPTGFSGFGGFGAIMLEWEHPQYSGHAYTEIWRGTAGTLESAVLIGTSSATVFGDTVPPGSTFFYWARHINVKDRAGPYHASTGIDVSTSQDISNVVNDIADQMRQSDLVNELTTGIDEANNKFEDMWGQKAQAGEITAGIGLLAKSDGTSQVAIAASQVFVFDPNDSESNLSPLFAIDAGNVIIPKALIETATIQILDAQTIVADEVKAGIAISTPTLNSAVINGAQINVGTGGPYNGYHTRITENGVIYTDYLVASGGRLNNITIEEDCTVKGTIYANKIVGDVTAVQSHHLPYRQWLLVPCGSEHGVLTFSIPSAPFWRKMIAPNVISDGGGCTPLVRYYVNGAFAVQSAYTSLGDRGLCTSRAFSLPPHTGITIQMNVMAASCIVGSNVNLYIYEQALSFIYIKA